MKYTKEYLEILVSKSKCIWDVIELAEIKKQEGNYRYIKDLITEYNISTSHFDKNLLRTRKPLDEYLVKGKHLTLNGNTLKRKLYKANLKQPICEICGQDEYCKGKKMSLILDHIDGDRENNTIENLRIVCPNCNATLETHCGKNISKIKLEKEIKIKSNNDFLNKKKLILESEIDFTKSGWG